MPQPRNTERDAAIVAAYQAGLSLRQVGDRFGIASESYVSRILERHGVQRRVGKRDPGEIADRDRRVAELYATGMTAAAVAAQMGLGSGNAVLRALRRLGITRRNRGRKPSGSPAKTERNAAIVQAYRSGLSCASVGASFGISGSRVLEVLRAAGEPRRTEQRATLQRHAPTARLLAADAEPITPAGVKVTVCPSGKDHRFTATGSEPFFSRGAVLPVRPWAQAVIGGRP